MMSEAEHLDVDNKFAVVTPVDPGIFFFLGTSACMVPNSIIVAVINRYRFSKTSTYAGISNFCLIQNIIVLVATAIWATSKTSVIAYDYIITLSLVQTAFAIFLNLESFHELEKKSTTPAIVGILCALAFVLAENTILNKINARACLVVINTISHFMILVAVMLRFIEEAQIYIDSYIKLLFTGCLPRFQLTLIYFLCWGPFWFNAYFLHGDYRYVILLAFSTGHFSLLALVLLNGFFRKCLQHMLSGKKLRNSNLYPGSARFHPFEINHIDGAIHGETEQVKIKRKKRYR